MPVISIKTAAIMPHAARMAIMMTRGRMMLGAFSESMTGTPVGGFGRIVLRIGWDAMQGNITTHGKDGHSVLRANNNRARVFWPAMGLAPEVE